MCMWKGTQLDNAWLSTITCQKLKMSRVEKKIERLENIIPHWMVTLRHK